MTIQWIGANANNFERGRRGKAIDTIVLHWIVGTLASADATFSNPQRVASAHYGVGGSVIHQYVAEGDTAYHAGNFSVNLQSIGIEHEGGPTIPITDATYKTSAQLVRQIADKYKIPLDRTHIRGHKEISATQCPGLLDIDRIIREAKAIGVKPASEDNAAHDRDINWNCFTTLLTALGVVANANDKDATVKRAVMVINDLKQKANNTDTSKLEQAQNTLRQIHELSKI